MRRVWLALALALLPSAASARVFQSRGSTAETGEALARRARWELAYQARMDVNGAPARVVVYQALDGVAGAENAIRAHHAELGEPAEGRSGSGLAWLVAREGGLAVQYLIQAGEGDRQTLITRIARPESEFDRDLREKPRAHRLAQLPVPAHAEPLLHQREAESGLELEVSLGRASAEAAEAQLERALLADGWEKALPGRAPGSMYRRGSHLAVITVTPDPDGGCRITRLFKPR
jgi:hypothetical protein